MNQKLNNTCIKCESVEHGAEIVKFYKDNGWDNFALGNNVGQFYGVFDGTFNNLNLPFGKKVLTLQEAKDLVKENQYPKVMWVSEFEDFRNKVQRVVIAYKCNVYIYWSKAKTIEEAENEVTTVTCNYAKDIEDETETKTRERIAAIEKEWEELKKLIK